MTTPSPDPEATARVESDVRFTSRPGGNEAQFAPGTIIGGRYRIAGILGSGGMGEVYRADDIKLGQQVALKFLPARLARDRVLLERLMDEVRLGRQITHPNVCRIYDIVDYEDAHFVAMEYVDGEDLSRLLRRIGRLANDKAVEIARGIAAGLAAAHAKGILHRDLKPANVMIDSHGEARIMDFGLALSAGDDDGTISGTPAYMAPEQLEGQPATVQSDLYSLGLVMYELFTGKRAHNARTLPERVRELTSDIATPSDVIRDIDPAVERVILRCLANDASQRPQSARQVIAALPGGDPLAAAMAAGETPSPRFIAAAPIAGSLRPRVAWSLLGATAGILALLLVSVALLKPLQKAGMARAPEVQTERARELLRGFGIPAQEFNASGITGKYAYIQWIEKSDRRPNRFHADRRSYPILTFWLREEHTPLLDDATMATPEPGIDRPPVLHPGAAAIEVDWRGRLFSLEAVPSPSWPARAVDWNALLAAAGLPGTLTPAAPYAIPTRYGDARASWSGKLEDGTPITVDAAMYRGVPVFFRITGPWDLADEWSFTFGRRFHYVMTIAIAIALSVAVVLAWRNWRARRGDRQGALRVGVVVLTLELVCRFLVADHEVSAPHEGAIVMAVLSGALLRAALLALGYLALEPFLRRRWPDRLVSWSRLIAGNWRDPMVARDVLIGLLAGALHTAVIAATAFFDEMRATGAPGTFIANHRFLGHARYAVAHVADAAAQGILFAFAAMVFLMLLTVLLRRRSLAVAGFYLLYLGLYLAGSTDPMTFPAFALLAGLVTFIVTRYGLVAQAAFHFAFACTFFFPMPDAFTWYTVRALIPVACMMALAVWAFRTSLGNQSPFGAASLDV